MARGIAIALGVTLAFFLGFATGASTNDNINAARCADGGVLIFDKTPYRCLPLKAGVYQPGRE
jgi:hypothetical protein